MERRRFLKTGTIAAGSVVAGGLCGVLRGGA